MNLRQGIKAVATAGTPVPLIVANSMLATWVTIQARKNTTTANTGDIYIGFVSGFGNQHLVLAPGETMEINAPYRETFDLATIFVDAATATDAVVWSALTRV